MPAGGKNYRPEGGIEPLRFSAPTGLKPATRTTECHLDTKGRRSICAVLEGINNTYHHCKTVKLLCGQKLAFTIYPPLYVILPLHNYLLSINYLKLDMCL